MFDVPPNVARDSSPRRRRFFQWLLVRVFGWRIEGMLPNVKKQVVVIAPHTSNWDFIVGLGFIFSLGLRVNFLGKHTIFWWPFGVFLRSIGGIATHRTNAKGMVDDLAEQFADREHMLIGGAPEGTRSKVEKYKTGFMRIATATGAPVVPAALDFAQKAVIIGEPYTPTGDLDVDMQWMQNHFKQFVGKNPENQ